MNVDIVGEDAVTQAIIERLIVDFRPDISILERLPARGGQIKIFAPKYNSLSRPVILLTDLDEYKCPPSLIKDWFAEVEINRSFLFRIAQEEAETWLLADREGFSKWLEIDINLIPLPKIIDKKKNINEIILPIKPSLFLMMKLASESENDELKEQLTPKKGAKKGPAYNSCLLPFIQKKWNPKNARKNSYSLKQAIERLQNYSG